VYRSDIKDVDYLVEIHYTIRKYNKFKVQIFPSFSFSCPNFIPSEKFGTQHQTNTYSRPNIIINQSFGCCISPYSIFNSPFIFWLLAGTYPRKLAMLFNIWKIRAIFLAISSMGGNRTVTEKEDKTLTTFIKQSI
jgi:hypothetical protein